jgi:hypothetical protein
MAAAAAAAGAAAAGCVTLKANTVAEGKRAGSYLSCMAVIFLKLSPNLGAKGHLQIQAWKQQQPQQQQDVSL